MAWTSQAEIQTYIYSQLAPGGVVDATLAGLGIQGVFDWMNVPQNQPFDYITLGDGYENPNDTLGPGGHSNGWLAYVTVHLWSTQHNVANIDAMADRINNLLIDRDTQPWTLQTLTHVWTRAFRVTNIYDTAGVFPVFHKAMQFQVYTVQQ